MSERFHRLPVLSRLGDGLHSFESLLIERDENLPRVGDNIQAYNACGLLDGG